MHCNNRAPIVANRTASVLPTPQGYTGPAQQYPQVSQEDLRRQQLQYEAHAANYMLICSSQPMRSHSKAEGQPPGYASSKIISRC